MNGSVMRLRALRHRLRACVPGLNARRPVIVIFNEDTSRAAPAARVEEFPVSAAQIQVRARATAWWQRLCPSSLILAGITVLVLWVAVGGHDDPAGRLAERAVVVVDGAHKSDASRPTGRSRGR